jgi:hypothetical protein
MLRIETIKRNKLLNTIKKFDCTIFCKPRKLLRIAKAMIKILSGQLNLLKMIFAH